MTKCGSCPGRPGGEHMKIDILGAGAMGCLFGALLLTLAAELVMFLFNRSFEWMNVVVALIFCGYIGFDWARAQQRPCTADNAIDSACALYLDIINLAMRILASRSRRRD